MKNKKVLVLVCAFNEQDAILKCLKSLKNSIKNSNAEDDFSVICVDNSSTDKTAEIALNFIRPNSGFSYVKIEHCNLCISRNTYKYFEDFDYIAYVDGDGYVDKNWAKVLINIIDNKEKVQIISGPVFDLETKKRNFVWEMFFNYELFDSKDYLIGANMIFSKELLNKVDGFPSFFTVRGDESSLLLRIKKLNQEIVHIFDENLIAYNFFTDKLSDLFKTQFTDGQRSHDISQLNGTYMKTKINGLIKLSSFLFLLLSFIMVTQNIVYSFICFFTSLSPFMYRHRIYTINLFKKIKNPNISIKFKYALAILLSRFIFDAGFLSKFIKSKKVDKIMLNDTRNPIILETISD